MPNFKNSLMRRVSVSTFILGALVGLQSPAFAGAGHSGGHNDGASKSGHQARYLMCGAPSESRWKTIFTTKRKLSSEVAKQFVF